MTLFKYVRFTVPLVIFTFILILLWRGLSLHPSQIPSPLINQPAPAFSLPSLFDPQKKITNNDLLGHVAVVNVWATWCITCKEEHPAMVQLAENENVFFVGLNYKDDSAAAKEWLEKNGNPYQMIAVDAQGKTGIDWGVYGTPETFVLDKKGIIRYKLAGPIDADAWENHLQPLLAQLGKESA